MCITWRSVLLDNLGAGGRFLRSVNCWALTHVPIQQSSATVTSEVQERLNIKRTNITILDFFNILIFISTSSDLIEIPFNLSVFQLL